MSIARRLLVQCFLYRIVASKSSPIGPSVLPSHVLICSLSLRFEGYPASYCGNYAHDSPHIPSTVWCRLTSRSARFFFYDDTLFCTLHALPHDPSTSFCTVPTAPYKFGCGTSPLWQAVTAIEERLDFLIRPPGSTHLNWLSGHISTEAQ